jgi:hypothetical protein
MCVNVRHEASMARTDLDFRSNDLLGEGLGAHLRHTRTQELDIPGESRLFFWEEHAGCTINLTRHASSFP